MITEKGSIKVTTEINEKMQKEFSGTIYKLGLAFTIIGAIAFAVCLAAEIASIILDTEEGYVSLLICTGVLLFCGIFILVAVNKAVSIARNSHKANTYEFFKDYLVANEYLNGENVATAKFYNGQITKAKETKNYLFFYINAASACPIDKSQLNELELNTLRGLFRLPVKGGTMALSQEVLPRANTMPEQTMSEQTKPEPSVPSDPFDEFKG